jgi:DeoR/GlpR family transcriptional regulator of sugar metabolism
MNGSVRQLRIRQLIESNEFVDLDTLQRELAASVSTLRPDLIELEQEGVLKRVYGGAMAAQLSANNTFDFQFQSGRLQEKNALPRQ